MCTLVGHLPWFPRNCQPERQSLSARTAPFQVAFDIGNYGRISSMALTATPLIANDHGDVEDNPGEDIDETERTIDELIEATGKMLKKLEKVDDERESSRRALRANARRAQRRKDDNRRRHFR